MIFIASAFYASISDSTATPGGQTLTALEKLEKENLDQELETLVAIDKKFRDNSGAATSGDPGPIFDIIRYWHYILMCLICHLQ